MPSPALRQGFARTDDGVELFYRTVGEGESAIVCCNGVGVSTSFWEYLVERFAGSHRILLWDYRGHGRSSRIGPAVRVDIPRLAEDLGAVMREAGIERAVLAGHSMGSQVILERYRQAPDQVIALISVLGTYGYPLDTFSDLAASRQIFDLVLHAFRTRPRLMHAGASLLVATPLAFDLARVAGLVDGKRLSRHDLRPYLHHLPEIGFDFFFRMAEVMGEHTAEDMLRSVRVPVLVIAGERDGFTPPRLAQKLAGTLPKGELVMLQDASHAGLIEQPATMNAAIAAFLSAIA
jgi:pimeloyl-ACP methyl ester carboxylesterase